MTTIATPRKTIRAAITRIAAGVLEVPVDRVDTTASFAELGLDSLRTAELVAAIEDALGASFPLALLCEQPSLDALAGWIEQGGSAYGPPRAGDTLRMMRADAELPADIRPSDRPAAAPTGSVLVTGATGFVGAHLLRTLLDGGAARVVCLVRGDGHADRVRMTMERYGVWRTGDEQRIETVAGNLAMPGLGLDASTQARLREEPDAIFHAAAEVDWVQPYAALRTANVAGTRELLRLASAGRPAAFHFLSSLAVCYSTQSDDACEQLDPMTHAGGIHLGYAQTKAVAEALVREAGRRGLPVRILRPALIAGDSRTGRSNVDDLVSLMLRGCVHMGAAPDLDWTLDAVPVEHVTRCITGLGAPAAGGGDVVHVVNAGARNWRECVLFLRLRGHPMRLLPYDEWAQRLHGTGTDPRNPLNGLRGFLLRRAPGGETGWLPELFTDARRTRVTAPVSAKRVGAIAGACAPLGPELLERYLADLERAGVLNAPPFRRAASAHALDLAALCADIEARIRGERRDPQATVTATPPGRLDTADSIVAELTSWTSGAATGLFQATFTATTGGASTAIDAIVKAKCEDQHVLDVADALASLCDDDLAAAVHAHRDESPFLRGHVRELALYEQADPRWVRHTPTLLGAARPDGGGSWLLALERVPDAAMHRSRDDGWSDDGIAAAIEGIAQLHAVWHGRVHELPAEWMAPRRSAQAMRRMQPLWAALAHHAAPVVHQAGGDAMVVTHAALARSAGDWWRACEEQVPTLIHNDFNPRNFCLHREGGGLRLCAYDWELAAVGIPQRDLAELLCFVLSPEHAAADAPRWIEHARAATVAATGCPVDAGTWQRGFVAALRETLVDRFASYAMVHRVRRQHFLPRILRTWNSLHSTLAR